MFASKYYGDTGVMFSVNDASLQYGGVIDNKGGTRLRRCHKSHRKGIDIDINNAKSGGITGNTTREINGVSRNVLNYVNDIFLDQNMKKIPSTGLHWRWKE
jgi:hypothetical protein